MVEEAQKKRKIYSKYDWEEFFLKYLIQLDTRIQYSGRHGNKLGDVFKIAYMSPRVKGDKFVTICGDSPKKSQNLVKLLSTILVNPSHFHHITNLHLKMLKENWEIFVNI